jgi:hypothetical protein
MMKTQRAKISSLALGLATITVTAAVLWLTPPAHAGTSPAAEHSSASGK